MEASLCLAALFFSPPFFLCDAASQLRAIISGGGTRQQTLSVVSGNCLEFTLHKDVKARRLTVLQTPRPQFVIPLKISSLFKRGKKKRGTRSTSMLNNPDFTLSALLQHIQLRLDSHS